MEKELTLEALETLETLIEKDHKIFDKALEKADELAQKEPDDPKKWAFVKSHIDDVYYDYVYKYDLIPNLENDVEWYGYENMYYWLHSISNASPEQIVQEAAKDYHAEDWTEYSTDQISDDSMEYIRPLW